MNAPPGFAPAASPRRFHRTASGDQGTVAPSFEQVLRMAQQTSVVHDVRVSHQSLVRMVRAFVATRRPAPEFADWVIAYADPTGETAVRNVLRERGR